MSEPTVPDAGPASSPSGGAPPEEHAESPPPPPLWLLVVALVFVVVAVVVLTIVTRKAFDVLAREEQARKLDVRYEQLESTRRRGGNLIGSYAIIDAKADRYRIPVDRALEVVARDPSLLASPVPRSTKAASASDNSAETSTGAETDTATETDADEEFETSTGTDANADEPEAASTRQPAAGEDTERGNSGGPPP